VLYHSNFTEPRSSNRRVKTAAPRRKFARGAFSVAAEETPIRENSAPSGASLYLQRRDLPVRLSEKKFALGACPPPSSAIPKQVSV
jgi:hypothetical protein